MAGSVSVVTIDIAKASSGISELIFVAVAAGLGSPTTVSDWAHFLSTEIEAALTAARFTNPADGSTGNILTVLDKSRLRALVAKCSEAPPPSGASSSSTTLALVAPAAVRLREDRRQHVRLVFYFLKPHEVPRG